jgi:putative oxidoreductase
VDRVDFALLVLRLAFGLMLVSHGYNKFFGPNGLRGTARWFESMGVRPGRLNATVAATTEVGAGLLFAAGLLTPLAAAGMIGLMTVAIVVAHWRVGWFIFRKGEGMEYCLMIAVAAFAVATIGAGEYSLDHALGWDVEGWWGAGIAAGLGVGGALLQLAACYRPPVREEATA